MSELSVTHRFVDGPSDATLLALHGTGGTEDDLLPLAREVAPEAKILSPRGQVLERGMPRFFRRLAAGVFDEADLVRRAGDLASFVRSAARQYGFDASRVYALGYSNGANIAAALLLLHPETLAGALLLRPVLPLEPRALPTLDGKPVLIIAGRADPMSPAESVDALADRLSRAGALVDLRWEPHGHELHPRELAPMREWAAREMLTRA